MAYSKVEQLERAIKIAHLYYDKNYSQKKISNIMHIDRTEISRILKRARQQGIVRTIVMPPSNKTTEDLAETIKGEFGIKEAIIAPTEKNNIYTNDLELLSIYAGEILNNVLEDDSTIGLSWGATMQKIIKNFEPKRNFKDIKIVPLIGSPLGQVDIKFQANDIVSHLGDKIKNSQIYYLESPVFINSQESKKQILATATNNRTKEMWKKVDIAVVGIGSADTADSKNWREFYNVKNPEPIYHETMVGDILSHPFSIDGNEYPQGQKNIVGMSLNNLRKVKHVIGVAAGSKKSKAVYGALKSKIFDILIITDTLASGVVNAIP